MVRVSVVNENVDLHLSAVFN